MPDLWGRTSSPPCRKPSIPSRLATGPPLGSRDLPAMTKLVLRMLVSCFVSSAMAATLRADTLVEVTADPASLRLSGPNALHSLLIHGKTADGRLVDLTRSAEYHTANPAVAQVADTGVVRALGDGAAVITV